jgi:hypothetical protein
MVQRGKHQCALENSNKVKQLLGKNVQHGFSLPVDPAIVPKLKGAMVQPAGLAMQFALLEDGSCVPKCQLTQDSSFPLTSPKASVNKRINMEAYHKNNCGWCLSRIIHFIEALHLRYPDQKIFIAKYDYSDAYCQVAHWAEAAVRSIIIFARIAYISLWLTFGESPNPPTYCAFSKMVTHLSNKIPLCTDWDHTALRSPSQALTSEHTELHKNIPIARAKLMAVGIRTNVTGQTDSFIDNFKLSWTSPRLERESPTPCHSPSTPLVDLTWDQTNQSYGAGSFQNPK